MQLENDYILLEQRLPVSQAIDIDAKNLRSKLQYFMHIFCFTTDSENCILNA